MKVRYKNNNPHTIATPKGNIQLMPGVNEVDAAKWAEAEKNGVVKILIDQGTIVPEESKKSFTELPEKQAIKAVEECHNVETLRGWLGQASDPKVKMAIKARLAEIEADPEKGKKDKK